MKYQLRIRPRAKKELEKLPNKDYWRINLALSKLTDNPLVGKKLEGEYQGYYSVKIWPYRIIYIILKKELLIIVIRIAHRQSAYK